MLFLNDGKFYNHQFNKVHLKTVGKIHDLWAGMSINLRSLKNVFTSHRFQYCIIDENAKVLYHSDIPTKNLNENLLEEFQKMKN
jgi:hypothetical protein